MKWNSNREASRMDRANMQMQVLEQPKATASRRPGWFAAGGVVGAILASTCCIAPLLLLMLGVSGAWMGNLKALEPYKHYAAAVDRKSVVEGKCVSVRGDLSGRCIIKKKKQIRNEHITPQHNKNK